MPPKARKKAAQTDEPVLPLDQQIMYLWEDLHANRVADAVAAAILAVGIILIERITK